MSDMKLKKLFVIVFVLVASFIWQGVVVGLIQVHPELIDTNKVVNFVTNNLIQILLAYYFANER
ncbi:hypothetical protein [Peribacillus sp. AS_2]|uniref:hypothetical protein n=1 Tax=Peribacillus sp. AS_2 TaxID=2996755 RepID=UPI0022A6777F|nr:hypothetical protein [Peribacillus sp. AS_2]MCZ0871266.1 hypothetical protein [Peribacillus sp. AS_2]